MIPDLKTAGRGPRRVFSGRLAALLVVGALPILFLSGCTPGYSQNPTETAVPPSPSVLPYACLVPTPLVDQALDVSQLTSLETPIYTTPAIRVSTGSSIQAGQCVYSLSTGVQLVVTVFPRTTEVGMGEFLDGASPTANATEVEEQPTQGLVMFPDGTAIVELGLDRDMPMTARTTLLTSIEQALIANHTITIPQGSVAASAPPSPSSTPTAAPTA